VTVVLKDNGGTLNGGADTSAPQTFNISVNKASTATVLTSSNLTSLFGVEITLTATVTDVAPGLGIPAGTIIFKDGTTALGTAVALVNGVATMKTSSLAVATHSLTAVYTPTGNFLGSTAAAISEVIKPSSTLKVNFTVHSMLDNTPKPKVQDFPVSGAVVKVYTRLDTCANGLFVLNVPFLWGRIYDGWDGVGGTDPGCTPVSVGSYQAVATTDALGNATIIVPPTASSPNTDYLIVGRTDKFDYIKTASSTDPLYSEYTLGNINASQSKNITLHQLATFNGKILPAKQTEYFGSYLDLVEPDYVDWTDDIELYPFVLVSQGTWDVTTAVAPPAGFVADTSALSTTATDTTTAMQFTLTDVGSDWTQTTVNHSIVHLGATTNTTTTIPMNNRRRSKARNDNVQMMATDRSVTIAVLANDYIGVKATTLALTSFTQPLSGIVTQAAGGTLVYTPNAGFTGLDSFTYTLTDDTGFQSTGTVSVKVFPTPTVRANSVAVPEGNAGVSAAIVTIALSNPSTVPVSVSYATADGTAKAGADYTAKSGTVTFNPGDTRIDVPFAVIGDVLPERNETFAVVLSNPVNAALDIAADGQVKILDEERLVAVGADMTVNEGDVNRTVLAAVTLSGPLDVPLTITYATADGTARAGSDYVAATGTLTFAPGVVSQNIPIGIIGDTVGEATEQFYIDLTASLDGLIGQPRMTISIGNDDFSSVTATTSGDFLLGGSASGGAAVVQTADGEVSLAPALGSEFFGTALPAGWTNKVLATGGTAVVGGGSVKVNGAAIVSGLVTVGSGRSLDFVATFTGVNQAVGLGAGTLNSPLAVFVTKADGLYSRTVAPNANGVVKTTETLLTGIDASVAHQYTIDWGAGKAAFRVDGTLIATHTTPVWGTLAMGATVIDSTVDASAVSVDWMRLSPFALSGSYTLRFDSGDAAANWGKVTSTLQTPVGTTATISYRIGSTATPDATWTAAATVTGSGGNVIGTGRYLEVTVQMSASADGSKVPVVKDLTATYKLP